MKALLYVVSLYFAASTPKIKKDLTKLYNLCGKKYGFKEHISHIYSFALIFTDRFLSKISSIKYEFEIRNENLYLESINNAVMILTSHIGDWHVCAKTIPRTEQKVHVVMQEVVKKDVKKFQDELTQESEYSVIDISEGFFSYGVKIANALKNKETVSIMVDRFAGSGVKTVFLGQELFFNDTPFLLAYSQKASMIAVFSTREADFKYRVSFEKIEFDCELKKAAAVQKAIQQYALLLEQYTIKYTNQWFNHYDIFAVQSENI